MLLYILLVEANPGSTWNYRSDQIATLSSWYSLSSRLRTWNQVHVSLLALTRSSRVCCPLICNFLYLLLCTLFLREVFERYHSIMQRYMSSFNFPPRPAVTPQFQGSSLMTAMRHLSHAMLRSILASRWCGHTAWFTFIVLHYSYVVKITL